jgi:hypothetical protein
MARARSHSKVDSLPQEVRDLIAQLLKSDRTYSQIMAKLHELDLPEAEMPSRSGLGRWAKQQAAILDEVRRSEAISRAVVERFGEETDDRLSRANLAMAHGVVTRLMFTEEGGRTEVDFKEANWLTNSIHKLAASEKINLDVELIKKRERDKVKAANALAVEKVAKQAGLSAELIAKLKASIFGKEAV